MAHKLPAPVAQEADPLLRLLHSGHYRPVASVYSPESFGNWLINFSGPAGKLRVVKDRGQFSFEGERSVLESANLWLFSSAALSELMARVETALRDGKPSA
jgi:hypothetical protein